MSKEGVCPKYELFAPNVFELLCLIYASYDSTGINDLSDEPVTPYQEFKTKISEFSKILYEQMRT